MWVPLTLRISRFPYALAQDLQDLQDLQGFLAILAVQDDWGSLVDLAGGAFLAFPDYLEGWKE